jgi:hypothetical protein
VTFHSQQLRAFNLIWALFESGVLERGKELAVIGGGLAGMTVAAAARICGCKVALYEKAPQFMHLQRGNFTRFIHPNIYDWPEKGSEDPETHLPCLNWRAEIADKVVEQIEEGWNQVAKGVKTFFGHEVEKVFHHCGRPTITVTKPKLVQESFDCVIAAVGFGIERTMHDVIFRSYWSTDALHQPVLGATGPKRYLVSGCGDGGLIDALRLSLTDFDHARFTRGMVEGASLAKLKKSLLAIDQKAPKNESEACVYYFQAYSGLTIPKTLRQSLTARLRQDTQVMLNGPDHNPMSPRASILNRFAVFLLLEQGKLTYQEGRITKVAMVNATYRVNLMKTDGRSIVLEFDDIVVRHGPEPIIGQLLPEVSNSLTKSGADPTSVKLWSDSFYPVVKPRRTKTDAFQVAMKQFEEVSKRLFDPKHVEMIGIGMLDGEYVYVVTLTGDSPNRFPSTINGIRIVVRKSVGKIVPQALPKTVRGKPKVRGKPPSSRVRRREQMALSWGAGIKNYDNALREGGLSHARVGSIGCFVEMVTGEVAILSTNHVLAGANKGIVGDRIVQGDASGQELESGIARLHSFVPLIFSQGKSGGEKMWNQVDAAIAVLNAGQEYLNVPHGSRLNGVATAQPGDAVFKVSRTTGFTRGIVVTVNCLVGPIIYEEGLCWFRDVIAIRGQGGTSFSSGGDSGAIVLRADGAALGMVFSGSDTYTYACPMPSVLVNLGVKLLL